MERISSYQLTVMIILFQIGSSPLFLLASEAKRDAWIAVLIAMICGIALLFFVTMPIHRLEPDKNLIEIIYLYFGPILGQIFAWAYVIYLIYKSVRNVRELSELTILYLLPQSPLLVISGILMIISSYAVYKGVEVFFRVGEFLAPLIAFIYLILFTMLLCVGLIHFNRLLPLLQEGIRPVISAALPEVISFPFGEMVLFLMFWKYLDNQKNVNVATLSGYSIAGLFLIFANAVIVAVLGPALAGMGGIPLMLAGSLIQIARVIERMDPFIAILLFVGVLIKQTAYYLGATLALATIFKTSYRYMFLLAGAAIYMGSMLFRSFMQQISFGFEQNLKYHFPIFQIAFPIFLLLVMKIRVKKRGSSNGGAQYGDSQANDQKTTATGDS